VTKSETRLNILIADDYAIVRKGLIQILSEKFPSIKITEAKNGSEVYEKVRGTDWDIILLDFSLPGRNGLEIMKQLRADGVTAPILMLGVNTEEQYAVRALKAGAAGFLNKLSPAEEFTVAFGAVLKGGKYISTSLAHKLVEGSAQPQDRPLYELLSDRELQVLQYIAMGKTMSEIAAEISLSINTISTYRGRILEKLGISNNAQLIRYALDNRLV
jgi:two-component system invasion response regulator UvrY